MADQPDVRVRLSAEGVAEVVAALGKVGAAGKAAGAEASKGFTTLNNTMAAAERLFGGLAASVSVGALVALGKNAAATADALAEASEGAGTTIPRLQTLSGIAALNGVSFDTFGQSLGLFSKQLRDLREGVPGAVTAFGRLNLTAKDFKNLDTAQAFSLVAQRMSKIENGAEKTAASIDLVGKKGKAMVTVFNALGAEGGLAAAEERLRAIGLVLDEDIVQAAGRVNDALDVTKTQVNNAAIAFVAGLEPAVTAASKAMDEGATDSANAWVQAGRTFGVAIKVIVGLLSLLADSIKLVGDLAVDTVLPIGAAIVLALQGNLAAAGRVLTKGRELMLSDVTSFAATVKARFKDLTQGEFQGPPAPPGTDTTKPKGDATAAATRRLNIEKALADNELKLQQLLLKNEADADARRYKDGLISLEEYYAARASIAQRGADAEIAALERRLRAERAAPDSPTKAATVSTTEAEIARRKIARDAELAALGAQQIDDAKKLGDARLQVEARVAQAQGQGHAERLAQIDEEVKAYRILLGQQGLSLEQQVRLGDQMRAALVAAEEFAQRRTEADDAFAALARDRGAIQASIDAGLTGELEGKKAILALDQERVVALQRIVDLTLQAAFASGDPEAVAQAQELAAQVRNLGLFASESERQMRNLKTEVAGVFGSELASFLAGGTQGFQNLKASALDAIGSIINGLRRLLAQILASRILELIGLALAPVPKTGIAPNPGIPLPAGATGGEVGQLRARVVPMRTLASLASIPAFAGGGQVVDGLLEGPGTTTSDSILARVSRKEFITKAAIVQRPGVLPLLRRMNAGMMPLELREASRVRGFAGGGEVGGKNVNRLEGSVGIELADGLMGRWLESRSGTRAMLKVMSKNPRQFRRATGTGG